MEKNSILQSPEEEKYLNLLIQMIEENFEIFIQALTKKISISFKNDISFEIVNTFMPFDMINFTEIIRDELHSFHNFLKTKDNRSANRGKKAAETGLSANFVLTIFDNFHSLLIENNQSKNYNFSIFIQRIIFIYMKLYIPEYIHTNYRLKNKAQEQLYESMTETISKQREEMLEKEKEQNRQIMAFLINAAHELKTPLTLIRECAKNIKKEIGQIHNIIILLDSIKQIQVMIENIFDNKKIKQGKILYNHEHIVNVSKIVASKLELYKLVTEKKNISLESEIQPGLYSKIASLALDRILNNILDNAIKYNMEKGEIKVKVTAEDEFILLIVCNTGIGIPADQLPHIFKPYYQSTHRKSYNQGIGAGLPLVLGIINEVNGKIFVDSIPDNSTTVTITLKKEIITEDNKNALIEDVKISKPLNRRTVTLKPEVYDENKKTILYVEDQPELLATLQKAMMTDFNFFFAYDGKDALQKFEFMPKPDVIISDVMMDHLDGYEFLKQLREKKDFQDVPFIFLTAKNTNADKVKAFKMGAVDFIEKPFSIEILIEKVKSLIRDHDVLSETEIERMERKLSKTLREKDNKVNYDLLYSNYKFTKRQREILDCILRGLECNEIAEKLFISSRTVRGHIQDIRAICGVENNYQLRMKFKRH